MKFVFTVEVEVERVEGLFASREDIGGQIEEALEAADYDQWDGENGGQYETHDWTVTETPKERKGR